MSWSFGLRDAVSEFCVDHFAFCPQFWGYLVTPILPGLNEPYGLATSGQKLTGVISLFV